MNRLAIAALATLEAFAACNVAVSWTLILTL
jgi:hypothetical protein